jgi:hypothetical protein
VLRFREPDLAAQQIDQIFRVALVEHGEVFSDSSFVCKLSQHRVAQRVKRSAETRWQRASARAAARVNILAAARRVKVNKRIDSGFAPISTRRATR